MTANEFPAVGATSSGAGAFVFERNQILNGLPARYVFFDEAPHNPPGAQYNGDPNYKLPMAAFVRPQCVYGYGPNCAPQKGGPQGLDVLGYRLMFRMPIRNFGRYESIAINHTVVANGADGIRRWGDYSDLTVDPADDCTFFYTTEYVADDVVVIGTWRTRVVSFRFPGYK